MDSANQLLAIVGPTASGKSHLAFLIAEKIKGEIVSSDSRQIYKSLNIGTAKPTPEQLQRIKHYFIDTYEPSQECNAGDFGEQARKIIESIFSRHIQPILVGGSGLYIRAVIDGFFEGPSKDPELRRQLEREAQENGKAVLYERLRKVDPVSASKMDHTKVRRVIRALEVYYTTGYPISYHHKENTSQSAFGVFQIGLEWDRRVLYDRINQRVDHMIQQDLIDEVRNLQQQGYTQLDNALNTVGYKETFDFLAGKISQTEMIELIKRNTRRFAKRQLTWFRADKRIRWIKVHDQIDWNLISESVLNLFEEWKTQQKSSN